MRALVSGSTATVRSLAADWPGHLGHLVTPKNRNSMASLLATGLSWAADNGAYSGFDAEGFRRFLAKIQGQPRCLFAVCPDVVADAVGTLNRFDEWSGEVAATGLPVAFAGQDGIERFPIPWDRFAAWFIGGSTRWKLSQASADLAVEAKVRGKWVHMGRVNTLRRLTAAYQMGCDSIDGSSMSMYGDKYIHRFCSWMRGLEIQPTFWATAEAHP